MSEHPSNTHCSSSGSVEAETASAASLSPFSDDAQNEKNSQRAAVIAVIDDQPINIKIIQKYLRMVGYERFVSVTDSRRAEETVLHERPDVVLLDLIMPHVDGLEVLDRLRRRDELADLPIIIVTAVGEQDTKIEALRRGATEFLQKPVHSAELQVRVRNALLIKAYHDNLRNYASRLEQEVSRRTAELVQAHREVVQCLATVGEYRDNETGYHTYRVGCYAEIIARHLGMGVEFCALIRDAATLHDIGKVAIPDRILLKPGKLDEEEFAAMKRHCEYGRNVCAPQQRSLPPSSPAISHTALGRHIAGTCSSPLMRMAATIAFTHHERWDGTGYPSGLKQREIPIEGRITSVADVFDALTTTRPYKAAFNVDHSLDIINQGRGSQFDPEVLDAFWSGIEQVLAIYYQYNPEATATRIECREPLWIGSDI